MHTNIHSFPGYSAPPTGGEVVDLGILDTEDNTIIQSNTIWQWPTHVRLAVQLVPQWAPPGAASGAELEYTENGVSKGVVDAHAPDSYKSESRSLVQAGVVEALQLSYRGQAQLIYADGAKETVYGEHWNGAVLQLLPDNILFSKSFATLPLGRHTCAAMWVGGGFHVTPPGIVNHWPRYALGGYYTPHADVTHMEQLYVTIDQVAGRTTAHAERSSAYQQKYGQYPPVSMSAGGAHIVFVQAANPLQQMSLAETIVQGQISLTIQAADRANRFVSMAYETTAPSCIDMVFRLV